MKKSAFLISFLFTIFNVSAQNYIDIIKLNANTTGNNKFDSSSVTTQIREIGADISLPIKINDSLAIVSGLIYEGIESKLFENQSAKTFGSFCLKAGINKEFSEKWTGTFVLLPKLASNFNKLGNNDFQMGAIAIFKHTKSDHLNYKYGLYYNSEIFGPFFVPMFGVYYLSPNKKFETNLMLPLQMDINYKVIPFINIGFNFNGQIRTYHLKDIASTLPNTYLTKSTNDFFAYLKFNFTKGLSLQTKVGQSVARSFRVYDIKDNIDFGLPAMFLGPKRNQLNTDFSNGLLFQVVLIYRVHL